MAESKDLKSLDSARLVLAHALFFVFGKALLGFFSVVDSVSFLDSESVGIDSVNALDSESARDSALGLPEILVSCVRFECFSRGGAGILLGVNEQAAPLKSLKDCVRDEFPLSLKAECPHKDPFSHTLQAQFLKSPKKPYKPNSLGSAEIIS